MKKRILILFALSQFVISCISEPAGPVRPSVNPDAANAAFILCEGSWGLDNSLLIRYDLQNNVLNDDFFGTANQGLKLGDLANDLVLSDSFAIISVTTARSIEVINANSGKSLGRIIYPYGSAPRKIAIINDSVAAVTDLYRHSISLINFKNFSIIADSIAVGPAPEGIAYNNELLFVVNSGYGDYMASHPKASTVSIIDVASRREIGFFKTGINPINISINSKKRTFYITFNHLPSETDSVGGIIEYSLENLQELRSFRTYARSVNFSVSGDSLFFISNRGLETIALDNSFAPEVIIENSNKNDIWYSAGVQPNGDIWIGNARNHQTRGEITVYSNGTFSIKNKIPVGVNPGKIIFYSK